MATQPGSTERALLELDQALLRQALWVAAAVALVMAVLISNAYVLGAIALGAATAASVASYRHNEMRKDFREPLGRVWHASVLAMGENGLPYGDQTWYGVTAGEVHCKGARIRVERHPGDVTRVCVRVGMLNFSDNHRRAALLLESVTKQLA